MRILVAILLVLLLVLQYDLWVGEGSLATVWHLQKTVDAQEQENLDPESKQYRCFKQLIERLNRTYKYHTRPRAGFKSFEGAVALTVLFVAYYNFMRPHTARDHKPPVELDCLQGVTLMPQAWIKIIQAAAA